MFYRAIATLSFLSLQQHAAAAEDNVFLRWASYGGGWRAMMADAAYANVFSQVGLFDYERPAESCKLQSISAESGGTWFAVQFFQSPQFFENVTESSPEGLYDFVLSWMNSYQNWTESLPTRKPLCRFLEHHLNTSDPQVEELVQMCFVLLDFEGDWALFVSEMLEAVSKDYGDHGFAHRHVRSNTRNALLMETEEYLQTSLTVNARIPGKNHSTGVYIGPDGADAVYAMPLAAQYSVTNIDGEFFFSASGGQDGLSDLNMYTNNISNTFRYHDYKQYSLFDGDTTTGTILIAKPDDATAQGFMAAPFEGRHPTVGQIASASSAAIGTFSGLVPSFLAQYTSVEKYNLKENGAGVEELALYQDGVNDLFNLELLYNMSVCSQWPKDCGETDGRFVDGTYTDMPTLALNVAQFQARESWDSDTVLKVFVTSHYQSLGADAAANTLAYFNSTYNKNGTIAAGEFMWPTETGPWPTPVFSPQIFSEYLTYEDLENVTHTNEGTNVTTAIIEGTTLDNPTFGVSAGLKVRIMLFRLNAFIPNTIIGSEAIELYKYELADMAEEIASSEELKDRVAAFVSDICPSA